MSPSVPSRASGSNTTLSASPVSSAENPSTFTFNTTLASLVAGSSTGARGHTTVSVIRPM